MSKRTILGRNGHLFVWSVRLGWKQHLAQSRNYKLHKLPGIDRIMRFKAETISAAFREEE